MNKKWRLGLFILLLFLFVHLFWEVPFHSLRCVSPLLCTFISFNILDYTEAQ